MDTIISALRQILGNPDFYRILGTSDRYNWDYGAMLEYFFAGVIVCIVVGSIFRLIVKWGSR